MPDAPAHVSTPRTAQDDRFEPVPARGRVAHLPRPPNEWQMVWDGRDQLHHQLAPAGQGRYTGHTSRYDRRFDRSGWRQLGSQMARLG